MCGPAAFLATAALVSGFSQYQTGQALKAEGNANAKIAEVQAKDAEQRGAIAEEEQRNRVKSILGTQRATFGANNVVTNSGSPLGILSDTAQYGEVDALTVRNNAAREAFGYRVEGENAKNRGRMAARQGTLGGISTVLAGGAQAYGIWRDDQSRKPKRV